jgi:hypothetical protein
VNDIDATKLRIQGNWLVYDVGQHTCGGYGPESGYAHEPGCGYEPVILLAELGELLTKHFAQQMAEYLSRTTDEVPW